MDPKLIQGYQITSTLGEGAYGIVYKGISNKDQQVVALKSIKLQNADEGIPATALREISLLRSLRHQNVVSLIEVKTAASQLILVFEFCDYDLKRYLKLKNNVLPPKTIAAFMWQLLVGIAYCHAHRVIHRDIKPQNLLITKDDELKLADFGLARATGVPPKNYSHEVITLWYRPPEVLLGGTYGQSIDIWSCGCIMAEMVNLSTPLIRGKNNEDQLMQIFKTIGTPVPEQDFPEMAHLPKWNTTANFPKFPKVPFSRLCPTLNQVGLELLKQTLSYNPSLRGQAKDLIEHPYFEEVKKDEHWKQVFAKSNLNFQPASPWSKKFGAASSSANVQLDLTTHTNSNVISLGTLFAEHQPESHHNNNNNNNTDQDNN